MPDWIALAMAGMRLIFLPLCRMPRSNLNQLLSDWPRSSKMSSYSWMEYPRSPMVSIFHPCFLSVSSCAARKLIHCVVFAVLLSEKR